MDTTGVCFQAVNIWWFFKEIHGILFDTNVCTHQIFPNISLSFHCQFWFQRFFEIFLSCLCFVQLSESRAVRFMASSDETCTSPHPAALRISVLSCFLVSLSSVPCCFTESAAEEPDMSVRILLSWFALLFLKGEDAKYDFPRVWWPFWVQWAVPLFCIPLCSIVPILFVPNGWSRFLLLLSVGLVTALMGEVFWSGKRRKSILYSFACLWLCSYGRCDCVCRWQCLLLWCGGV